MITYKTGSLLDASETYIAHGCNCQGKMGAGVAKLIRDKWPIVFEDYIQHDKSMGLRPGDTTVTQLDDNKFVINLMTQEYYGTDGKQYVSYEAVRDCFHTVKKLIGGNSLAIPKIGSGLAGGDWDTIAKIIEEEMGDTPVSVYVL